MRQNSVISRIAHTIFSGYNVPENLKYNKGNKLLHINVEDEWGYGGDFVVPKQHPEMMIDAISNMEKGREVRLSFNPGASHVTNWWFGKESSQAVLDFLDKTGLRKSIF